MATERFFGDSFGDGKAITLFSHSNGLTANLSGVLFQWEDFPTAIWFGLDNFQNLFRDYWKSSENISFSKKSSKTRCIYLGLIISPPPQIQYHSNLVRSSRRKKLFLLLMEANLVEGLQGMSLGEDKSIVIPDEPAYCAMERGGRSILGRLLNPECQNMGRMLRTMPKVWKVYDRARGIALTKERFQFVFDLETDIQMVLNQGFWTFDDWGMALEKWVEKPPPNYLQTAMISIRPKNLPPNYLTWKTIDAVADGIGHVKVIEFDPDKPHVLDYVRVQVILDVNQPLRDKKSLTLPKGRVEYVDVEYERVRKKCFHCFRLSHEKPRCPLLQRSTNKGKGAVNQRKTVEVQPEKVRQHHTDLVDKLLPLLAPSVPPGFEPSPSVVVPEVFEQMKLYMDCVDPEERKIREAKMRKTLQELSKDPIAQRSCLRLESAPVLSPETNKGRGRVFDFSRVNDPMFPDGSESSSRSPLRQRKKLVFDNEGGEKTAETEENVSRYPLLRGSIGERHGTQPRGREDGLNSDQEGDNRLDNVGGFVIGSGVGTSGTRSGRSKNSHSGRSSWVRRNQIQRRNSLADSDHSKQNKEEMAFKRKAQEDGEVSSKGPKQVKGSMVSLKPSADQ